MVKSGVCPAEYSASASLSIDPIYLLNLGPDSTICFSTGHQWSTTLPDTFASILWSTGATDTAITVKHAGILTLNVSTKYGCKAQDEVVFEEYCVPNEICFPDVITPNNDGINDVFMPCFDNFIKITDDNYKGVVDHIEFISFEIFNRWGVLLFASENTLPQWDGDKGSSSSPDGTYYWIVNYRDQIKHENHQQTGYLTVMGKN
ncbi:MAG: gliding motility-associated C-terminal domain-containing protein [Bacteroidetes bacterium]|nr:gliding motility-associated C-terminal domain-containing protein [Bacteroidota bacterium]